MKKRNRAACREVRYPEPNTVAGAGEERQARAAVRYYFDLIILRLLSRWSKRNRYAGHIGVHSSSMHSQPIRILTTKRDQDDGLIVTFSDGTTGAYVAEELLELRPYREPVKTRKIEEAPPSYRRSCAISPVENQTAA
jgi:hypothetical protein